MSCAGCQKRREAIATMAKQVGTVVFGGRRRVIGRFSEDDRKEGDPAGLDQSAAFAGAGTNGGARPGDTAGTAGDPGAARGSIGERVG